MARIKIQRGIIKKALEHVLNTMFTELYAGTNPVQYTYYTDGTITFRTGVRASILVTDKTLTATGFDGIEDTDWENLEETV